MGIFSSIRRGERRSVSVVPASLWRGVGLFSASTVSGQTVTPDTALKVAAVYACVSHQADTIAMLPLALYQELPNNDRELAKKDPLYKVIKRRPNRWQTSFEWRRMMAGHMLLRGNAYSRIVSIRQGVDELVPMHPDRVTPFWAPDGDIAYHYQPERGEAQILLREEVHHWRYAAGDLLKSPSPIQLHAESIGLAAAALEHGARIFTNGAVASGVFKHPKKLDDAPYLRLKESLAEQYVGMTNRHKPILLEDGMDFTQLSLNADEVQMIQTRIHQVTEICSIWRMNPLLIGHGDKASQWGSGVEQITIGHLTFTVSPLLRMIEQAMERDLVGDDRLDRGLYVRFTDAALLRVDIKSQADYYQKAIGGNNSPGWMSRNEVRGLSELNRVDGLDEFVKPNAYSNKSTKEGGNENPV